MTHLLNQSPLEGKLIRLAAPLDTEEWHGAIARWSHDEEYIRLRYLGPMQPRRKESSESHMNTWVKRETAFTFGIRTIAEGKLIGWALLDMNWVNQVAMLGMGIGEPEYRNRGYGTDLCRTIVSYGFRELGAYKVSLLVFSYNHRARRLYEKCGFHLEATVRESVQRDGVRHDNYYMGITRPEWEQLPSTMELMAGSSRSKPGAGMRDMV